MRNSTACIVICLSTIISACSNKQPTNEICASGHIEATEIRLSAKVGGRLLEFPFEEGSQIKTGELVAHFETIDAEHLLAQARAEEQGADASLRLLLSGTRSEDLRRAEEELAVAQAQLDQAKRDFIRLDGLTHRGSATEKALDDARTRLEVSERAHAASRSQLDKLISGPRREEIEMARAHRAAISARILAIEQSIEDADLRSPAAGVLTTRVAELGEILAPGTPVGILSDVAKPWLSVFVDEPNLVHIRLGDAVPIEVDGYDHEITGRVSFISPVAEFTPKNVQTPEERAKLVFRIKIALENPDGLFKIGMPADARFKITS